MIADKLTTVARNERLVYEAGKQMQYDAFWDAYQQNGTRTHYREAFSGLGWTEDTFKPKYPIKVVGDAERMFHNTGIKNLLLSGVDFSRATSCQYMFGESKVESIDYIDVSNATVAAGLFAYCYQLHTIGTLVLNANGSTKSGGNMFNFCPKLQNVTIMGTIAESMTMTNCNSLSRDSIASMVNALSDTVTGLTFALPATAIVNAFGSADSQDWLALVSTKPNWSINTI